MPTCLQSNHLLIGAIDESLRETFATMMDLSIEQAQCLVSHDTGCFKQLSGFDVSVIVGLSGDFNGECSISLRLSTATLLASKLIAHETDEIDETVMDAVAELGNMVVGCAKRGLASLNVKISLPKIVREDISPLSCGDNVSYKILVYKVDQESMALLIVLKD